MGLTTEEARKVADAFLDTAKIVDEYLDANYQKISREEYEFLYESFKTLLRVSSLATTAAVNLAIDALREPATEMKNVIDQAKQKIMALQNIGRVIRLVAGLTDLAAGIMARDSKAIVTSLNNLANLISE